MNIRKKLLTGSLTAILSIGLIGGGTWAAFNDVESVSAGVGAGELNLDLQQWNGEPYNVNISDLKPGDTMTREINMVNTGTLAIKDVLLSIDEVNFTDYIPGPDDPGYSAGAGANTAIDYLNQFEVSVILVGAEGGSGGFPKNIIIDSSAGVTLADFYLASDSLHGDTEKIANGANAGDIAAARAKLAGAINPDYIEEYRINVATINPNEWTGIPIVPHDPDRVRFEVSFIDDSTKTDGLLYDQNIYQGDRADITLTFEARQWGGLDIQDSDLDASGYVETNERANSEAGNPGRPTP